MHELKITSINTIDKIAKEFISYMGENKIFAFYGEMGVGKTTFIKQICKELGTNDEITSPTFSLVNEYKITNNKLIYHFDFYRIENPEEALDFGIYEYFDSGSICLLEWPEMIEDLLPDNIIKIRMLLNDDNSRDLYF